MLDKIKEKFQKFYSDKEDDPQNNIRDQIEIVKLYLEIEQYQQAITLLRELVVSKVCKICNLGDINNIDNREKAEEILNSQPNCNTKDHNIIQLKNVWNSIRDIRNDINHAGMRSNARKTEKLITEIRTSCNETIKLLQSENQPNSLPNAYE